MGKQLLTPKPNIRAGFKSAKIVINPGRKTTVPSGKIVDAWGRVVLTINEHSTGRLTSTLSRLSDCGWDVVTLDAAETDAIRRNLNRAFAERERPAKPLPGDTDRR